MILAALLLVANLMKPGTRPTCIRRLTGVVYILQVQQTPDAPAHVLTMLGSSVL